MASNVLTVTEEIRFLACLDGDRIGGFAPSSMTPGKQGLFALTLILNQSQEAWPLLIDQPEDDLDSRSIYQHIVPYLNRRKTGRQIIMVTHERQLGVGCGFRACARGKPARRRPKEPCLANVRLPGWIS